MNANEQLSNLLHATFPVQPMPTQFFWLKDVHDDSYEFRHDLLEWLGQRLWTEVKLSDWTLKRDIVVSREHLEPVTFLYYLPSLLIGVMEQPEEIELALEAIIPPGRDRKPKRLWWRDLIETISLEQCKAIRAFVAHIRDHVLQSHKWRTFSITAAEALTSEAETFWDAQIALKKGG
jgi:uncharacterized protein DUF6714